MTDLKSLAAALTTLDGDVDGWAVRPLAPREDEATAAAARATAEAGLDDDATRRVVGAARNAAYFHNAACRSAAHHVRWRRGADPAAVRLLSGWIASAVATAAHLDAVRAELGL